MATQPEHADQSTAPQASQTHQAPQARQATTPTTHKQRGSITRILAFAGKHKRLTILGCALSAVNALCAIATLVSVWFVVRDLLAVAPHWDQAPQVITYGFWALGFAVGGIVIYFGALMCTHLAAFRTATNMRKAALSHLARVPLGYFTTHSTGELRRVIEGSTGLTENVLAHHLPDFVGALVTPFAFLVVMFVFDWVLGLLCLIPIVVSAALLYVMIGSRLRGNESDATLFMRKYQNALDAMNKAAVEYVRGIPVVKVFQQTAHSFKSFQNSIIAYRDLATAYIRSCERPQVAQLVAINATFVVLVPAGILLAQGAGDFSLFLTNITFYMIFSTLTTVMMTKIMYTSQTTAEAQDAILRIERILGTPLMDEVAASQALQPVDDAVEFVDVSFTYPKSDVCALSHISLKVPSGSTVALVGPSGGGKTTAASLVPRFWDVSSGAVLVGGVDVRNIALSELMERVAFVFQNDRLFKQSLADNISAARPSASRAEVEAAAHAAQCDDIIAKLPQGLDTLVGSKGIYLSGGECQRIALARAILKDAPIVVLDEATAFADSENEALIQKALAVLCKGKTVLMIAHRLSTITAVDAICVLDGGKLVEKGTHAQLVEAKGLYARMWAEYQTSAEWRIGKEESHVA